eukprot:gene4357-3676_t
MIASTFRAPFGAGGGGGGAFADAPDTLPSFAVRPASLDFGWHRLASARKVKYQHDALAPHRAQGREQ